MPLLNPFAQVVRWELRPSNPNYHIIHNPEVNRVENVFHEGIDSILRETLLKIVWRQENSSFKIFFEKYSLLLSMTVTSSGDSVSRYASFSRLRISFGLIFFKDFLTAITEPLERVWNKL